MKRIRLDEETCENCWYFYDVGRCYLPAYAEDEDEFDEYTQASNRGEVCGYFKPKAEPVEVDEYDEYQRMWN